MLQGRTPVEEALAKSRNRASWNARLEHWEKPASDSEEARIQRAAALAVQIVNANATLAGERIVVRPQGSYFNNTNVRLEADMDLRVQLPGVITKYAKDVDSARADIMEGYKLTGRSPPDIAHLVRDSLAADCRRRFGLNSVTVGKKAITVKGLSGSRADVDLVPAFRLHWISNNGLGGYSTIEGVCIVSANGSHTINFPEQHHVNGKAKRVSTQHRFKKVVRMLKRLNYELEEAGTITRRAPSFLVECLVYVVEDAYFLQTEELYDRLVRVCHRIRNLLNNAAWTSTATEVNEIKFLFHPSQAWTLDQAKVFINAALVRLGA